MPFAAIRCLLEDVAADDAHGILSILRRKRDNGLHAHRPPATVDRSQPSVDIHGDSQMGDTSISASRTVADLLERIEESWRAFLTSLDDLTEEQLLETGAVGEWSLKELHGHIAFWDGLGRENAALALSGQPPRTFDDVEELNQVDHAARRGRTLAEERSAMHQAHAALVADLEERAALDAVAIDAAIAGSTYEHYDEHAIDVRAWRVRRGY
jgi:hypothetical protein